MTQRKLRRKRRWKGRARRQRAYKHNAELHAYEESVVLGVLRQHGPVSVTGLMELEPNRWRPRPLYATFKRLERRGYVASRLSFGFGRRRITFRLTTETERKAA